MDQGFNERRGCQSVPMGGGGVRVHATTENVENSDKIRKMRLFDCISAIFNLKINKNKSTLFNQGST